MATPPTNRLELAEHYLRDAEALMGEGDAANACEKAYSAAVEVVIALAEALKVPEYEEAVKEGKWTAFCLGRAANRLSKTLGRWVVRGWSSAFFLYVWGTRVGGITVEDMRQYFEEVKEMCREAKKVLKEVD